MTWEHERGRAYEAQYARGEEIAFKAAARRNHLLAQWASQRMGLRHRDKEGYVKHLVTGDVGHARGPAIIDQVTRDLQNAGVATPREQVAAMFEQLEARVHAEIAAQEAHAADRSWI